MLDRWRLRSGLRMSVPEEVLGGRRVGEGRSVEELRVRLGRPVIRLDIRYNGVHWRVTHLGGMLRISSARGVPGLKLNCALPIVGDVRPGVRAPDFARIYASTFFKNSRLGSSMQFAKCSSSCRIGKNSSGTQ